MPLTTPARISWPKASHTNQPSRKQKKGVWHTPQTLMATRGEFRTNGLREQKSRRRDHSSFKVDGAALSFPTVATLIVRLRERQRNPIYLATRSTEADPTIYLRALKEEEVISKRPYDGPHFSRRFAHESEHDSFVFRPLQCIVLDQVDLARPSFTPKPAKSGPLSTNSKGAPSRSILINPNPLRWV